jgi:hypothetical protein
MTRTKGGAPRAHRQGMRCGVAWFWDFSKPKEAGMRAIRTSWGTEADHLVGRWSEAMDIQVPYNPPWMRDAAKAASRRQDVSPLVLVLDFRRLSPFWERVVRARIGRIHLAVHLPSLTIEPAKAGLYRACPTRSA